MRRGKVEVSMFKLSVVLASRVPVTLEDFISFAYSNKKSSSPVTQQQQQQQQQISQRHTPPLPDPGSSNLPRLASGGAHPGDCAQAASPAEAWPSLQPGAVQGAGTAVGSKPELLTNGSRSSSNNSLNNRTNTPPAANGGCSKTVGNGRHRSTSENNVHK